MLRYAITDSVVPASDGRRLTDDGVDFVQLRAKHLEAGALLRLAREVRAALHEQGALLEPLQTTSVVSQGLKPQCLRASYGGAEAPPFQPRESKQNLLRSKASKLLINGRVDVALAAEADGVHLTAHPDELRPEQVRQICALAGAPNPLISVSTHTIGEVQLAQERGADLILFGPVFEKRVDGNIVVEGVGLERLQEACITAGDVPVLALGGVTEANAALCVHAGAAGVAGIRLFA